MVWFIHYLCLGRLLVFVSYWCLLLMLGWMLWHACFVVVWIVVGTLVGWLCVRGFGLLCGWWFDLLLVYLLLISFALRLFAVSWLFCRLICLWLALAHC